MKLNANKSIFEYKIPPFMQAAIILGVTLISLALSWIAQKAGLHNPEPQFAWVICFSFLLFYALMNCLMSFSTAKPSAYWRDSILSYMALATIICVLCYWISGTGLRDSKSFKWILMIFTFSYLVLLTIMRLMRQIVNYAQNEQYQAPGRNYRQRK